MEIKVIEGNIPIDKDKLNKYRTVRELFDSENDFINEIVINDIEEMLDITVSFLDDKQTKKLARRIFANYHKGTNIFINNKNRVMVTYSGIDESITKIRNIPEQKELLEAHLMIFSMLGLIIENSRLVSQSFEYKKRAKYIFWNYYFCYLKINHNLYKYEFEVVSMDNGENHYRIQRLKKIEFLHGDVSNNTKILPFKENSICNNNISQ